MNTDINIIQAFLKTAGVGRQRVCVRFKSKGRWRTKSWDDVVSDIGGLAAALSGFKVPRGGRVAICSRTSYEWTLADLSILVIGAITVPIYSALPEEMIAHVLADSEPSLIFAENFSLKEKIERAYRQTGKSAPPIVIMEGDDNDSLWVIMAECGKIQGEGLSQLAEKILSSDIATIIYTSGTMGEQKGVVITHENIIAEVRAAQERFDFTKNEIGLHCLPLAHVLGRLMQFYQLVQGCESAYAESMEKLAANFIEVRPHFVCGVPRMLEKIHELILLGVEKSPALLKRLFRWAEAVGDEKSEALQKSRTVSMILHAKYFIADLLIFRRIRMRLGGRLKKFICGGAPLAEEIARFFHSAGFLILEGYGLTETFAAVTANQPYDYRFGTVGKAFSCVDIKLASDGEILVRGKSVFKEYWNLPEETSKAFDRNGFFLTGDIGEYSRDGFLRIIGRKKDIFVTAGGKNVAPQMIESLMSNSPFINHFMAYGDGRKFLVGLVAINVHAVRDYLKKSGRIIDMDSDFSNDAAVNELIARHIEEQNAKLASFETIKKFAITSDEFTVAGGELTPTFKIRRSYVADKYRKLLDALY